MSESKATAKPPLPLSPLPIDEKLPELLRVLAAHSAVVLSAPPGAGKTTRAPPALVDSGLLGANRVLMLQPRRVAARAAAARMAEERGERLGGEIGYHIRFERRASRDTRVLVATEGVVVRMLQDDPFLEGVGCVVFDEFHERGLHADLALAMVRRVQTQVRPDLKILVMSATLDAAAVAPFLGDCPAVASAGRLHPVDVRYLRHDSSRDPCEEVAAGIGQALRETTGDVLAFLPGKGEIRRTREMLAATVAGDCLLCELHGDLPVEEQHAALRPALRRKIVLSTNVAETSVTVEGVTAVVDSGKARVLRCDPNLGLNRLELVRISRASADQRAGRAGRTAPGVCWRLWTEREQRALQAHETPEIMRVDLSGAALELLCWGESPREFPWFEAPPAAALDRALELLARLGAVERGELSPLGRQMARLPVHPRIARLLVEGHRLGCADRACLLGSLLSERDPFAARRQTATHWSNSDLVDRVSELEEFARGRGRRDPGFDPGAAKFVLRAAERLRDDLRRELGRETARPADSDEALRHALYAAYADRLARRREPGGRRGVLLGGRGVRLAESSAVVNDDLFVCVDLGELGKSDAAVRLASAVERDWLPIEQLHTTVDVEFDPARERVVGVRRTRLGDLVLDEAPAPLPAGAEAASLLAREAAARLDKSLRLDEEAETFLARLKFLQKTRPEFPWPDLGDDPIRALLPRLCEGRQSFAELRAARLLPALAALLDHNLARTLAREAPERLELPGGRSFALRYAGGQPPILAARIQDFFGLRETPRVAAGRAPVLLHLLAPSMRPQQITDDLPSFWKNTYPQIRQELARRYPKHAWPEDPLQAQPRAAKPPSSQSRDKR